MEVLIIADGYLPGYKFGGPVRSLAALVDQLGDNINFSLVTSGSDLGEAAPYPGIELETWNHVGKARVFYTMKQRQSPIFWRAIINECKPDVIYLNGLFSARTRTVLVWRRLGLLPEIPIIVAPRGELSPGALAIKARKKNVFLAFAKRTGLYRAVTFQASTPLEREDIQLVMGKRVKTIIAPNLATPLASVARTKPKRAGSANFVWISRISPKKNLETAISFLKDSKTDASLTIFGPIEDEAYWSRCKQSAAKLPDHVSIHYPGPIKHEEVPAAPANHDFLLFPTLGENFGHVIAEALNAGLPILVSDQTPWRNLEEHGVGWDVPLDDTDEWARVINYSIDMNDEEYQSMSSCCRAYVKTWMDEHGGKQANLEMFRSEVIEVGE